MPIKYEYQVWVKAGKGAGHNVRTFVGRDAANRYADSLRKHAKRDTPGVPTVVTVKQVSYRSK